MLQHGVGLTDHFLPASRKLQLDRRGAYGRDHRVRFLLRDNLRCKRRMEAHLRTRPLHQPSKGNGRLFHLFLARSLARRDKLAAQTVSRLKNHRMMAPHEQHPGRLQAGHSAACDIDPFRSLRLCKLPLLLVTQTRISQTCDKRSVP